MNNPESKTTPIVGKSHLWRDGAQWCWSIEGTDGQKIAAGADTDFDHALEIMQAETERLGASIQ